MSENKVGKLSIRKNKGQPIQRSVHPLAQKSFWFVHFDDEATLKDQDKGSVAIEDSSKYSSTRGVIKKAKVVYPNQGLSEYTSISSKSNISPLRISLGKCLIGFIHWVIALCFLCHVLLMYTNMTWRYTRISVPYTTLSLSTPSPEIKLMDLNTSRFTNQSTILPFSNSSITTFKYLLSSSQAANQLLNCGLSREKSVLLNYESMRVDLLPMVIRNMDPLYIVLTTNPDGCIQDQIQRRKKRVKGKSSTKTPGNLNKQSKTKKKNRIKNSSCSRSNAKRIAISLETCMMDFRREAAFYNLLDFKLPDLSISELFEQEKDIENANQQCFEHKSDRIGCGKKNRVLNELCVVAKHGPCPHQDCKCY